MQLNCTSDLTPRRIRIYNQCLPSFSLRGHEEEGALADMVGFHCTEYNWDGNSICFCEFIEFIMINKLFLADREVSCYMECNLERDIRIDHSSIKLLSFITSFLINFIPSS